MGLASRVWGAMPFAAMVMVECTNVGVSTISKAAMSRGMSNFVFVVYYNALGTLIILPYFIFHRKKRAPLTLLLLCVFFLLGLIGGLGQTLAYTAIKYSSPTLASAMGNLIPIYTFLLAVIFRMEKLDLTRSSSRAKSLGTILTVSGAFIITFYKGPSILVASPPSDFLHRFLLSQPSNWVFGGLLLALSSLMGAIWNIVQTATVKEHPEEMTIVFFYCLFLTIQCAAVSLIVERNPDAWTLKPGIEMIAIASAAIFGSVFRCGVHTCCLLKKGPVYVAMFKPLGIAIAVVLGVVFLQDTLHLGSVIGAIIIALGFYTLTWGHAKEKNMVQENGVCSCESSHQTTPLLQSRYPGRNIEKLVISFR